MENPLNLESFFKGNEPLYNLNFISVEDDLITIKGDYHSLFNERNYNIIKHHLKEDELYDILKNIPLFEKATVINITIADHKVIATSTYNFGLLSEIKKELDYLFEKSKEFYSLYESSFINELSEEERKEYEKGNDGSIKRYHKEGELTKLYREFNLKHIKDGDLFNADLSQLKASYYRLKDLLEPLKYDINLYLSKEGEKFLFEKASNLDTKINSTISKLDLMFLKI